MTRTYNHDVILQDCNKLVSQIDTTQLMNKTLLITGANGLIGGFLTEFCCFLNDNYNCNLIIYCTSYRSNERIKQLIRRSDVHYFQWDASEKITNLHLPNKIDVTFFCSGYGQPTKFLKNNIKTSLINVVGLESILEYMNANGGGHLAFMSTSEIYGNPPDEMLPTPETYGGVYDLHNNRAAYKVSKTMGEVLCKEYCNDNFNIKIFRTALTYGPGALFSDKRVLQEFIFKAYDGRIDMFDEGESIRNYLYITDAICIFINTLFNGKDLVYNVGGDTEPISIFELACKIGKHFKVPVAKGKSKNINVKTAPKNVGLDMSKYRNEFPKHVTRTLLDDGIRNTIKWYNLKEEE
jgi:dTDP-glucose 4,6-dehydratase/UDP-glucuronate decarboxylase